MNKHKILLIHFFYQISQNKNWGFPGGSVIKNPSANPGDMDLIPGLGRPPGEGNGNPLQYFCLGNFMDRRLQSMRSQKNRTRLSD